MVIRRAAFGIHKEKIHKSHFGHTWFSRKSIFPSLRCVCVCVCCCGTALLSLSVFWYCSEGRIVNMTVVTHVMLRDVKSDL